ncbi:hypothetical protein sS8_2898 [Methylocaldum marinum]|uniref:Uncharacterized protein n=1 Tax=Methylocaldum marinum TaxID=1432792 RepID=A0A250KT33_9GAMM|nr:hypothetical protein sS8_2898 [Methylocaldum marinum]
MHPGVSNDPATESTLFLRICAIDRNIFIQVNAYSGIAKNAKDIRVCGFAVLAFPA